MVEIIYFRMKERQASSRSIQGQSLEYNFDDEWRDGMKGEEFIFRD